MRSVQYIIIITIIAALAYNCSFRNNRSDLYCFQDNVQSRCFNFENYTGAKGSGGKENKGAKGHAFERLKPGERKMMFDFQGCGIINHMWLTLDNRTPEVLRSLKIEMYWDNAKTPAVQVPFGDFFCSLMGKTSSFENYFFSNPEGRSFNCYARMPFRKAAKIFLINESEVTLNMFYDIDFVLTRRHDASVMYFHAYWNREPANKLEKDFTILPTVHGKGCFIGTHIAIIANPIYENTWWGEGEVKMFLDGDNEFPTIIGTGAEDYPGSGYGLNIFNNRYQGCLVADAQKGEYGFYRYHIADPVFFNQDCRVTIQEMGGAMVNKVIELIEKGAPLKSVTFEASDSIRTFIRIMDMPEAPILSTLPEGWINFYRSDDWSAVSFFYLDKPENGLPPIAGVDVRLKGIK
jgi:hypothetical protein